VKDDEDEFEIKHNRVFILVFTYYKMWNF
jgi:hypothetical protein